VASKAKTVLNGDLDVVEGGAPVLSENRKLCTKGHEMLLSTTNKYKAGALGLGCDRCQKSIV